MSHHLSFSAALALILFGACTLFAQESDPFSYAARIQPSAEAWQIARHGEISPDLHTGAMAWSLPLYTYKDEDFTIPISLDYRFDGCRPSQPAGTVGMGWNLNCGGVITRQVVGLPDDYIRQVSFIDTENEHHESWEVGFYFAVCDHSIIPPMALGDSLVSDVFLNEDHCIGQISPILFDAGNNALTMLMGSSPLISKSPVRYMNGYLEGGPFFDPNTDIYHFSVSGLSGDFIILPSGHVKVYNCSVPEGEVQVSITFQQLMNSSCFSRITIFHQGYQYEFGGDLSHIEYSFDASTEDYNDPSNPLRYCFSALRLGRITAPNGRRVSFDHSAAAPCCSMTWKNGIRYRMDGISGQPKTTGPGISNLIYRPVQAIVVDGDTLIRMHYANKDHAEFGYSAFHSFHYNTQYQNILPWGQGSPAPDTLLGYNIANRLSSVVIWNRNREQIDSISLSHFYTSSLPGHSSKMFLNSVSGNAGRYSFSYLFPLGYDAYPVVDTVATDHWGYWNGGSSSFSPTATSRQRNSLFDLPHSGKEPDTLRTRHGALYRLEYPSGGWSQIEYENNTASRSVALDTDDPAPWGYDIIDTTLSRAGGVRVHRITSNAGTAGSFESITEFDYCNSGTLMQMPRYYIDATSLYSYEKWMRIDAEIAGWEISHGSGQFELTTCDNSGLPLASSDGHILYSQVRTYLPDGSFSEHLFADPQCYPDHMFRYSQTAEPLALVSKTIVGSIQGGEPVMERMYYTISGGEMVHNTSSANLLLSDFACLRGRSISERSYAADSSLIKKTDYTWSIDTAAITVSVLSIFSCFAAAPKTFVQPRLDSVITTEYLPGGGSLSDTTLYTYNNLGQQTVVEKRGFDGSVLRSRLRYEHECDTTAPRANVSFAATTRFSGEGNNRNEYVTSLRHFEYDPDSARHHLPILSQEFCSAVPWVLPSNGASPWYAPLAPHDTLDRHLSYNALQRPALLSLPGGAYVAFTWDASGRYPLSREDNGPAMVSSYQWKDMVGLSKKTDPTLRSEWYAYDDKCRLSEVRRADSIKVTAYDYHLWCEDSTQGPSYTKQTTWRTSGKNNREIVYYDGLGYPIQTVRTSTQNVGGHIVTPIRYDALRRDDVKAYLPYEALSSNYDSTDSTQQSLYYKFRYGNGEVYPFAEKEYGTSPAGRLLSARQPGKAYADSAKRIVYEYRTNTLADSILNLYATVDTLPKLKVGSGYLPSGKLLLTKTTDEDGCTSEVFTNSTGRTVLARQRSGGARLDTYYVYDLRDSLVCVLQPEGAARIVKDTLYSLLQPVAAHAMASLSAVDCLLERYAFLYAYDSRGRLRLKKKPGAAPEEFVPDDRGRIALSRDGNLRDGGKWLFNEYDAYDALLKRSLTDLSVGQDTLWKALRAHIDSSHVIVRDSFRLWEFVLDGDTTSSRRAYSKKTLPAMGDTLYFADGRFLGYSSGTGYDSQGIYFLMGDSHFYPSFQSIFFDAEWGWQRDTVWYDVLLTALDDATLLEEHRYDRGDSSAVPAALAFSPVTGIVSQGDLGSTRNLELWQRQLLLPPGRTVPGDTLRYVERAFYYDTPGNTVQTVERNALGGISRTSAKYDYLGNVLSSEESHAAGPAATADRIRKTFAYDTQGRVATETASLPGRGAATTFFDYDIFGHPTHSYWANEEHEMSEFLSYDIRGRLSSKEVYRIVAQDGGGEDRGDDEEEEEPENPEVAEDQFLFGQYLRYHSPLKAASQRRWNGLISEIAHQRTDTGTVITNGYFYDHAGRLTDHIRYEGSSQTNKYTERDLSFDRNGNILSLKRYGTNVAAPQDNLAYTYEGNKLMQLNGSTYQYDANGNMTHDGRRGLDLSWNHLNLPSSICSNEDEDALVNYTYLTDGTKVITQQPATGEGYAYLGSATYKLVNNVWTLESVPFTGGRFIANATGGMDEYRYITDHLGSTRLIVKGYDYQPDERNDYYPFGMRIADNTLSTNAVNRWRFSGKEIQTLGNIGLVDFGARLYDDFRGQWPTQDPLTEKLFSLSSYSYCAGNPMNYYDYEGAIIIISGSSQQTALLQIQEAAGKTLKVTIDENGKVSCTRQPGKRLSRNARKIARIIGDKRITINLITMTGKMTSTGHLMVGGAFMGNTVEKSDDGETTVQARQEVNPDVLSAIDESVGIPGTTILHEITEAYAGALLSRSSQQSSPPSNDSNSVYPIAHEMATPQPPVREEYFDFRGVVLRSASSASSVQWVVYDPNGKKRVIQRYP